MTVEHSLQKEKSGMRVEWGFVVTYQGWPITEKWGFDTRKEAGIEATAIKVEFGLAKVGIGHRYVAEPEEIS